MNQKEKVEEQIETIKTLEKYTKLSHTKNLCNRYYIMGMKFALGNGKPLYDK